MEKQLALIVEDDPQLNSIFSLSLRDDFEIVTFTNGENALRYLLTNIPHLVVLDLNLPGVSGVQILNYIKSQHRLDAVHVILATADAARATELSDRADLVLLKPISPVQLKTLAARLKI